MVFICSLQKKKKKNNIICFSPFPLNSLIKLGIKIKDGIIWLYVKMSKLTNSDHKKEKSFFLNFPYALVLITISGVKLET